MTYSTQIKKNGKTFTFSFDSFFECSYFNRSMKKNGFLCENVNVVNPSVVYETADDAIESLAMVF